MKILILTPDYPPEAFGGIGTYTAGLVTALSAKHQVTVIVARMDKFLTDQYIYDENNGVCVFRFLEDKELRVDNLLNYYGFRSNYNSIKIGETVCSIMDQQGEPDVIHVQDHYCGLLFDIMKQKFPKAAMVTTIHSCRASRIYYEDSIRRYVCASTDAVVTVSESIKREVEKKYHNQYNRLYVLPCGIENEPYRSNIHEEYLTYAGRIHSIKGVDILIEAYKNCMSGCVDANKIPKLLIMGDGPEKDRYTQMVQKMGLSNKIQFTGQLSHDETLRIISQGLFHIIPSTYEAFGLSALEAMSLGKCVVASAVGGMAEYIVNDENGYLVEAGNVGQLKETLTTLLNHREKITCVEQRAYSDSWNYTWNKLAIKAEQIYKLAIDEHMDFKGNPIV